MLLRTIVAVLALVIVLDAAPITFTLTGTGSGSVASTPFSDVAFTFTLTTDTTLITTFVNGFRTPQVAGAGVSIAGFGNGTFTNTEHFFDNTTNSSAGLSDSGGGDLLDGKQPDVSSILCKRSSPCFASFPGICQLRLYRGPAERSPAPRCLRRA